ncbi:MAG: putative Zn-dependent peptidase [Gemmatimonadetes bacterium]|nr:putative Zn-dependent peptidase [Gemmatimonadota bacterium]
MRIRSMVSAAAALALALLPTRVAQGQKLDRSIRPLAPAYKAPVFPAVNVHTLPNGLRVAIVENHALPIVGVRAVLSFDSTADAPGKEGVYAVTLGMLREGTTSRSAEQIATLVGSLGSDVSPTRFTTVTASADRSLALMADMLTHPAFPSDALERRKAMQATAVQRQLQSPGTAPRRALFAAMFGAAHPVARSVLGSDATVKSITRDDVANFYGEYFRPENVTLVVVGDVRSADVLASVARLFGPWQGHGSPYAIRAEPAAAPSATTIYLIDRPNAQQAYAYVGQLGPSHSAADVPAMEALAPILGFGAQSRLARNIRERHAYMYSGTLYALSWQPEPRPSMLYGSGAFAPIKTDSALAEWISELKAIRADRPPTPEEMASARAAINNNLSTALETVDRLADRLATYAHAGIPLDFDNRLARSAATLSSADVRAAAAAHIDPEHLAIVVAGDRVSLEPTLRALKVGPVVVVDESGKRLP